MTANDDHKPADFDPALDLFLTRHFDAPRAAVWQAWSKPQNVEAWFCPKPAQARMRAFELRTGGAFCTDILTPDGANHGGDGMFAEVVPGERIVTTDSLLPGWRPNPAPFLTVVITLKDEGTGTRYTAHVRHPSEAVCRQHEEMGFREGWGIMLDQLEAFAKTLGKEAA